MQADLPMTSIKVDSQPLFSSLPKDKKAESSSPVGLWTSKKDSKERVVHSGGSLVIVGLSVGKMVSNKDAMDPVT